MNYIFYRAFGDTLKPLAIRYNKYYFMYVCVYIELLVFLLYYEMKCPKCPLVYQAQQQRSMKLGNLAIYEVSRSVPNVP